MLQTILDESELPEDVKSFKLVLEEMWNMARKVPTDEEAICKDVANECDGQGCPGLKRNFRGSHQYHRMHDNKCPACLNQWDSCALP